MTTAWAHLPNAKLIYQVLDDLKNHPSQLAKAFGAAQDAAQDAACNAAWNAAWNAALILSQDAILNASRNTVWDTAWSAAWSATWSAIMVLIAYDDCGFWLSPEFSLASMKVSHRLTSHPSTLLLQPYKLFLESSWVTGQT